MRIAKTGILYKTSNFKIGAGITGRAGACTTSLYADKVLSTGLGQIVVTVTELGATGIYYASFTPAVDGVIYEPIVVDPVFAVAGFHDEVLSVAQPIVTAQDLIDAIADDWSADGKTLREALRALLSNAAGKSSGFETGTPKFRNLADTKNVISATLDSNGNRTTVTVDTSP